ncbi:type II toxin-antitoxin system RelE/ParE family toxin [Gryllotalpicola koreensis]|uniref:Type II toxin-antitoxin system RelE/ParE family toxin n=1 Tax=Gryllotalpicola koreensis TaxID=993086 RepID=A0ABP8A3G2_9MICO
MRFADRDTEEYWLSGAAPRRVPPDVRKRLVRRLQLLDAAGELEDLRIPPSNHLEKFQGNQAGSYSIRVNDQWRLVFGWDGGEAIDVVFIDYH